MTQIKDMPAGRFHTLPDIFPEEKKRMSPYLMQPFVIGPIIVGLLFAVTLLAVSIGDAMRD